MNVSSGAGARDQIEALLFNPTPEHAMLRETVRRFAEREVEPQAEEHDANGVLNRSLLKRCGDLGLLGLTIPDDDGGSGMDAVAAVIAHHELAKADPGFTLAYLAHCLLFVNNFYFASTSRPTTSSAGACWPACCPAKRSARWA
jgi:isovaleryl-CoA dehydrogenase